jgi:hypothetical protein
MCYYLQHECEKLPAQPRSIVRQTIKEIARLRRAADREAAKSAKSNQTIKRR